MKPDHKPSGGEVQRASALIPGVRAQQHLNITTCAIPVVAFVLDMAMCGHFAVADDSSDYKALCAIWRKTDPGKGKEKGTVTPEERAILLRELRGRRKVHFSHDFRHIAAIALGNLRASEALDELILRLKDSKENANVSGKAALALGKIGDLKALAPLLDSLLEDRVWLYAAKGLRLLSPSKDHVASVATRQRFVALLEKAESVRLPQSEREWQAVSACQNRAYWAALKIDALCTGLRLGRPPKLAADDIVRAKKLAAKLLSATFPKEVFQYEAQLPELPRFCREFQPELFAKKVEGPWPSPARRGTATSGGP